MAASPASDSLPPVVELGPELSREQVERYARHLLIPEIGMPGQRRLGRARVLVAGAGGLGSPALLYLAAAGVGTLGVVDDDVVDRSNLQRQVLHGTADVGRAKTESAAEAVARVNPLVRVRQHQARLEAATVMDVLGDYDLVVDGTDNFPTRYLLNDACVLLGKPLVWASILRFDGQVSVWWPPHGPCLRCVFPEPPPAGLVPSCAEAGVLGALCGAVGSVQAAEAVKVLLGVGQPLVGRLMVHDALRQGWDALELARDPGCAVCGERPSITQPADLEAACALPSGPVDADRVEVVTAAELAGELSSVRGRRPALVDVRGEGERAVVSIPGALAVPLEDFRSGAAMGRLPDGPLVTYCKTGARSAEAAALLGAAGRADVRSLDGGVLAWVRDVDPSLPTY